MRIRPATAADLALLPQIEARADDIYKGWPGFEALVEEDGVTPARVSDYPTGAVILTAVEDGDLSGFVFGYPLGGLLYIQQIAVVPEMQRQGIGAMLLDAFADAARARGLPGVSLITYAQLPFNAPFYQKHGFRRLAPAELGPELAAALAADTAKWGQFGPRVAMAREV